MELVSQHCSEVEQVQSLVVAFGGLTGSFGAQIALAPINQQIDTFVAGMVDAGKALTSVGGAADFMAEKSLFSSDAMQFRIDKLIEEGKVTEAAALMTQEMAKQVGGSGLKALKDLGTEASKMGKIFSTLLIRVQAFLRKSPYAFAQANQFGCRRFNSSKSA